MLLGFSRVFLKALGDLSRLAEGSRPGFEFRVSLTGGLESMKSDEWCLLWCLWLECDRKSATWISIMVGFQVSF